MQRSRQRMKLAFAIVVSINLFTYRFASGDGITVFERAPAPEVLADILYGPRYRGTAKSSDTQQFGMMINFEYDSTVVLPDSLPLLDSVGKMLDLEPAKTEVLVIEGHADASGSERHNHDLSIRRARAIKKYLVNGYSVDSGRLVTVGQGESNLHNAEQPEDPINRRVVFRTLDSVVIR